MNKIFGLTFSIALQITCSLPTSAQWVQTNGPFGGTVTAMAALPDTQTGGAVIFAATDGGGVYISTDNGMQWQPTYADLQNANVWRVMRFLKGLGASTLYAETSSGAFCTTDMGKTWNHVSALFQGCDVSLVAIYINTAQDTVLLGGTDSGLVVSTDAGRNWVLSTTPPVSFPTSIAILPATKDSDIIRIVAGTMWNGIYISSDNGMTWTPSTLKGQIGAVAASDSVIYAGVYADRIYRSTDEGTSWTACGNGLPLATDVRAFAFIPNRSGGSSVIALSEPSEIFLSTNNGDHWNAIKNNLWAGSFWSLTTAQLNSDTSAIFVGTESGVFRSANAGFTWDVVNQGLSACIVTALGVSKTSIFAGTIGNGIFRSSDQGFTWIPVNNGLDSVFIESIQTYGGLTVNSIASFGNTLLAGTLAGIFRSTDEGATWTDVNNDWTRQQIWSFTKSDSAIFAGGSVFLVFRSTDDGKTWNHGDTSFSSGSVMALTSENGKLFAAAMEGGAYRSTDNGASWSKIYSPGQSDNPYAITYVSPYLLLGAGTQGLFRSSDDGNTWTGGGNGLPADCNIYDFVVTGSDVFAGTIGGVFLSTDFGLHWSNVSSQELNTEIISIAILGSDLVAGTEGAGVIWKRPLSEMIAFSNVSERLLAFDFKLEQNYPNPFNPITTIKYSILKESFVTIKVFDILGKEITTLVNERKSTGKYSVNFNASYLPSGIYFYRMQAIPEGRQSGSFVSIKKFVLLK
jgi:photosystem II stability/assembly factor-like uncharacterized protein